MGYWKDKNKQFTKEQLQCAMGRVAKSIWEQDEYCNEVKYMGRKNPDGKNFRVLVECVRDDICFVVDVSPVKTVIQKNNRSSFKRTLSRKKKYILED